MYAASEPGHHKVYIVDEAHMLTREAWNALLKILEEPPPGVVFVFATTEPQKIANTAAPVMSRLQRFDFRRIGPAAIQSRLRDVLTQEGVEADDDALLIIGRHADGGMRDALSVLDQCLSFGEGRLTADRVRDVLGLVDDESYAAILTLVADRRPADVFAVLDRLVDSGADLAEFAGGLGEILRALLMHQLGVEAEALPTTTREVIAASAPKLASEDVVRMLKLLGEAEQGLRRSANPRLVLETLLLRWAMMDRALDLKALLSGTAPGGAGPSAPSTSSPRPTIPPAAPTVPPPPPVPAPDAADTPPSRHPDEPAAGEEQAPVMPVPRTTAGLHAVWPEILTTATRQSRLLGQALEHATPEWAEDGVVGLRFGADEAVFREGVERQLAAVVTILSARMGTEVRVSLASNEPTAGGKRSNRMTVKDLHADRLRELRRKDPALDAAADALDLELVEEE